MGQDAEVKLAAELATKSLLRFYAGTRAVPRRALSTPGTETLADEPQMRLSAAYGSNTPQNNPPSCSRPAWVPGGSFECHACHATMVVRGFDLQESGATGTAAADSGLDVPAHVGSFRVASPARDPENRFQKPPSARSHSSG